MHKAVARDHLRKAGWGEPQIRMALRIIAYDGARSPQQVPTVLKTFAERSDEPSEATLWQRAATQLTATPELAEALFALSKM